MTTPLAFVFYEKLLPGQQVANRLQDIGYRVQTVNDAALLESQAQQNKPMLIVFECSSLKSAILKSISSLKNNTETSHIPVLAYTASANVTLRDAARVAGATLVASETGLLEQLPQLLDQILQVD